MEDVSVRYGQNLVLDCVSWEVWEHDFAAVIGPNGGGKTTLLKALLGLLPLSSGRISIFGHSPGEGRRMVGYVPQFHTFDFSYPITVTEMVMQGRLSHIPGLFRRYRDEDHEAAERALGMVGLFGVGDLPISTLSGGQQQRVIIARALAGEPRLLILDEPTVYVDAPTEEQFFSLIATLLDEMTVIIVTHDIGAISGRVNRIACLNRRLYTHGDAMITDDMLISVYGCPVDLIAHGVPHRVLREHDDV
ncbi:ABC transporter [Methanocalculus chunghsingensis]|uniref:ABC transporter n=2 Tax=Methanocalculus chunghsingensis TaxID=156457 RepID=A0A8J7WB51_9EURY|nr:ABC transporter ATP-binding protein [Methanocalculus chunghsingensis]MBR1369498.1 ABC transporter [Methanocalculus chunghsingensis]